METGLPNLFALLPTNMAAAGRIALILFLTALALRAIRQLIPQLRDAIVSRQQTPEDGQRVRTLSRVARYILTVATSLVSTMLILGELGISVAPILGAAGVVGIAVGFGAQSLVKDYFTGFFLLLENQIRLGDVVDVGGKSGLVEEITLRYLRLRDYSGNVHYIPNGMISTVTNMSLGHAFAVIDVSIAYGEKIDRVIDVMRQVGLELRTTPAFAPNILEELEIAGVEQWAESAVMIRCRFKVAPLQQWAVRREYLQQLKARFDSEGIEIPFPHVKLIHQPA
jgi:small conductance mechanosensitive channel